MILLEGEGALERDCPARPGVGERQVALHNPRALEVLPVHVLPLRGDLDGPVVAEGPVKADGDVPGLEVHLGGDDVVVVQAVAHLEDGGLVSVVDGELGGGGLSVELGGHDDLAGLPLHVDGGLDDHLRQEENAKNGGGGGKHNKRGGNGKKLAAFLGSSTAWDEKQSRVMCASYTTQV